MAKYRKKPVVIEAVHWDGNNNDEIINFYEDEKSGRFMASERRNNKVVAFFINTFEGAMRMTPGDWIIKGIKGEFYPCKPDIFEKTYEIVEEPV